MTTLTKAGRYEIVGELGRGAMGIVYRAVDPVIGRTVAVKTIRLSEEGTGLSRTELLLRFQTEARAAGLLTHPNIVIVYDAGEEDGLYYITMELVEGKSLQALLDDGHVFPIPRVLRILEQTCSALHFAHERNVVHRDIKPANLMLTGDDTVKVTDFGTAKILQFGTVQQTAHVVGTPSYMSPEQVKGRAVDGRSDLFSLGVMLYEMITGEKPFPGQNITTVIYKIVNEDPVPPRQLNPSIHPGISSIVMRALAKDPDQRYQSGREMLEDLRQYRSIVGAAGNPQATMAMGGSSAASNFPLGINGGRNFGGNLANEDAVVAANARSLTARATSPGQTPSPRRTGAVDLLPESEPQKKNVVGTIFAAVCLIGVIVWGANKLKPVFEDARQLHAAQQAEQKAARNSVDPQTAAPESGTASESATTSNATASGTAGTENSALAKETPAPAASTAEENNSAPVEKAPAKKPEPTLSAKAAEYKGRIEEAIAEHGLASRAKVLGTGNTLTIAGKLKPSEHGELLKFLGDAPSDVHVVDHIQEFNDPSTAAAPADPGARPVLGPGEGAIRVITDVPGATALLHGSGGRVLDKCQTPCSFNHLNPDRYSLEIQKDGYQPLQTALSVKAGNVQDAKLKLEALAKGLYVSSAPAGADVFINGAKQSGQTPVLLPLAAGQYDIVLRLSGYEAYANHVQVKDNIQTQLDVKLNEKSNNRVAWAQVETTPGGAAIVVDGADTGQVTPARVQLPVGVHTVILRLNGYQQVRRTIQVSDGGTVTIQESLKQK